MPCREVIKPLLAIYEGNIKRSGVKSKTNKTNAILTKREGSFKIRRIRRKNDKKKRVSLQDQGSIFKMKEMEEISIKRK